MRPEDYAGRPEGSPGPRPQGSPGMPGREAEDMPVDAKTKSASGERDLTPSAPEADRRAADEGADVLPFRRAEGA